MRVKLSANPPLPPVRAWFPLTLSSVQSTSTISSFKSLLCTALPAFRGVAPSSLRLSIDGFELLDNSELAVVRDGDLICIDVLDVPSWEDTTARDRVSQKPPHATLTRLEPAAFDKRKRRLSTSSSSSSESESESTTSPSTTGKPESESETSDSESRSGSDESSRPPTLSLRKAEPRKIHIGERAQVEPSQSKPHVVHPLTFTPPGYGKPQTRARNLRRRLKRMHEREVTSVSEGGPVSGANAQVMASRDAQAKGIMPDSGRDAHSGLLSLSLRNKNKAKNFKSLMGRSLAPKIIFGDQEGDGSATTSGAMGTPEGPTPAELTSTRALPRLVPPSWRSSLPANLFVTSIDVEADMQRKKKKRKLRIEYGDELSMDGDVSLNYGEDVDKMTAPEPKSGVDIDGLGAIADEQWATLDKLMSEEQVTRGTIVGYKALGINPTTYTPEQCLTVGRVVSCDGKGVVVRPLRARTQVSFSGPVVREGEEEEEGEPEEETAEWADIRDGDWRLI